MNRFFVHVLALCPLIVIAGCSNQNTQTLPNLTPEQARSRIVQLMPAKTPDRQGWASDIYVAFAAQGLAPNDENLC